MSLSKTALCAIMENLNASTTHISGRYNHTGIALKIANFQLFVASQFVEGSKVSYMGSWDNI